MCVHHLRTRGRKLTLISLSTKKIRVGTLFTSVPLSLSCAKYYSHLKSKAKGIRAFQEKVETKLCRKSGNRLCNKICEQIVCELVDKTISIAARAFPPIEENVKNNNITAAKNGKDFFRTTRLRVNFTSHSKLLHFLSNCVQCSQRRDFHRTLQ